MKRKHIPPDAILNTTEDWSIVAYFLRDQKSTPVAVRRMLDLLGWAIQSRGYSVPEEKLLLQRYAKGI